MVSLFMAFLRKSRAAGQARREAELRAIVTEAFAECYDARRQAERLARWDLAGRVA